MEGKRGGAPREKRHVQGGLASRSRSGPSSLNQQSPLPPHVDQPGNNWITCLGVRALQDEDRQEGGEKEAANTKTRKVSTDFLESNNASNAAMVGGTGVMKTESCGAAEGAARWRRLAP